MGSSGAAHIQRIDSCVRDEAKTVSCKWLSRDLCVPVHAAKQMLWEYAQAHKEHTACTYLLAGHQAGRGHVVRVVPEGQLDEARAAFESVSSQHVYSVGPAPVKCTSEVWVASDAQTHALYNEARGLGDDHNALTDNRFGGIAATSTARASAPKALTRFTPSTASVHKSPSLRGAPQQKEAAVKKEAKPSAAVKSASTLNAFFGSQPAPSARKATPAAAPAPVKKEKSVEEKKKSFFGSAAARTKKGVSASKSAAPTGKRRAGKGKASKSPQKRRRVVDSDSDGDNDDDPTVPTPPQRVVLQADDEDEVEDALDAVAREREAAAREAAAEAAEEAAREAAAEEARKEAEAAAAAARAAEEAAEAAARAAAEAAGQPRVKGKRKRRKVVTREYVNAKGYTVVEEVVEFVEEECSDEEHAEGAAEKAPAAPPVAAAASPKKKKAKRAGDAPDSPEKKKGKAKGKQTGIMSFFAKK